MAEVTLPQLGETVTEGTITQWFKQIGDTVVADEPLFEVSTDKVDTEVPSPVAGTLTEIRVQEGETVDVGTVIAVVGDGDGAAPAAPAPAAEEAPAEQAPAEQAPDEAPAAAPEVEPEQAAATEAPAVDTQPAEPAPEPEAAPQPAPAPARGDGAKGILLSPVVRRLVNEHGLDPASITGTGPGGRITRDDVLDHIDESGSKPAAAPVAPTAKSTPRRPRPPAARTAAGARPRRSRPVSATRRSR